FMPPKPASYSFSLGGPAARRLHWAVIFGFLKERRRNRLKARPFPNEWLKIIKNRVAFLMIFSHSFGNGRALSRFRRRSFRNPKITTVNLTRDQNRSHRSTQIFTDWEPNSSIVAGNLCFICVICG